MLWRHRSRKSTNSVTAVSSDYENLVLPGEVEVDRLQELPSIRLIEKVRELGLRANVERTRHQMISDLMRFYCSKGVRVVAEGVLELTGDVSGLVRYPRYSFKPCQEDVYVGAAITKSFGLRAGQLVKVLLRLPQEREKFIAAGEVLEIEGKQASEWEEPKSFDSLTPMFPDQRILLENSVTKSISARAVDLIAPLGRGQRGLIVAPPRVGKTILMKEIAQAIRVNSPEIEVILLLIDERPEEVTDLERSVNASVYSSTFDESPTRHIQVAELVSERAKRLVELGRHVVVLLDSITRLARGYNAMQPAKGRIMSGGVEAKALMKPKRFFGAARNVEEGGSLTILATALVETQSRMDDVIFEEFKGTGNMELHLDRSVVEKRIYPAIHILNSGTRREELLYHPQEKERINILRKQLAVLPPVEAMEVLVRNLNATNSNAELLLAGLR